MGMKDENEMKGKGRREKPVIGVEEVTAGEKEKRLSESWKD